MAGNGVNVKMGVTGVAQFKQNINTAKQSLKTLDAQLALNEKQFKATGDSEAYMQQKSELLKVKLEEQKAVAANAEKALQQMAANGVDKASKAYQDMQRQLLQAKGEMLDTEAAMNGISDAGDTASDSVSEMNQQLKRVGDGVTFQNVTKVIDGITGKMEAAARSAIKLGRKIVEATLSKGQWADELATEAAQFGVSTDELQRMRKTETLIDTSVEAIIGARKKLKKGVAGQSKETMGAFAALGIDPKDTKDAEDLFWKTGSALMALGDEYEQEAYAQKLFGKSWNELIPLFTAGREEYEKTNAGWTTLSDDQLDNLLKMDDQYQKLTIAWNDFQTQMLSTFSGPLTEGMEAITGLFEELNKYLQTPQGKAMLEQMGKTVSGLIEDLVNINPEDVVNGLQSVINGIRASLEWIDKNHEAVVTAMGAIVAGWGLLKLTGGALKVLELVTGLQALSSGGAAAGAAAAGAATGSSWGSAFAAAVVKAAPWLIGLYEMLNPSSGSDALGDNTLLDENGELTEEAKHYGYTKDQNGDVVIPESQAVHEAMVSSPMHGKFTDSQYQMLQDYWDKYRTGAAKNEDWAALQEEFGKSDAYMENFLEIAKQIYGLDRNLEDLPEDIFSGEAVTEAADKMEKAAETLSGTNETQKQSSSDLTNASTALRGVGGAVCEAVRAGMSGISVNIDGQAAGEILMPYISGGFARNILTEK